MPFNDPLAVTVTNSITQGDIYQLRRLLGELPDLALAKIIDAEGCGRTLLHVVTDWPGHFPKGSGIVSVLVAAGADVNARFTGPHAETPLHWAASSGDTKVLAALIDAGADMEVSGAVIAGGTPLDNAVGFGQWSAVHSLVERGARTALWHAAAIGLMHRIEDHFTVTPLAALHPWGGNSGEYPGDVTIAFWCACHGGQREAAEYLLNRGADINWMSGWDGLTPLDAAIRRNADLLVEWLGNHGAKSAAQLTDVEE